jgi:hypothetical protein
LPPITADVHAAETGVAAPAAKAANATTEPTNPALVKRDMLALPPDRRLRR